MITIDLGNSFIKIGYFKNDRLESVQRILWSDLMNDETLKYKLKDLNGIYSSVLSPEQNRQLEALFPKLISFDKCKLPIELNYKTPETLGKDRICNAVGAWNLNLNNHSLSIDIGTCIKFDFVSKNGSYEGGSISPGIKLRYKSLNDYTANLPLLNEKGKSEIIGKSTKESIHSGVINGMHAEISFLMRKYEENYESLTIFVTGGDAKYFDFETKNNIFANENLTLEGLYKIYLFNVQ